MQPFFPALSLGIICTAVSLNVIGAEIDGKIEPQPYAGGSIGSVRYKESDYKTDHSLLALRAGLQFNKYFSGEFRFGRGSNESNLYDFGFGPTKTETEIERFHGIYLRGHVPLNEALSVYGILGKTKGSINYAFVDPFYGDRYEFSDSETDTSFGFGIEFFTQHKDKPNFGLGLEFMEYIEKDGVTIDGFTASAIVRL